MCGFCNVWVCVCVGFVMCACVYMGFFNVWMSACVFLYIIIYSACGITVNNITCTVNILHNYLSSNFSFIFYLQVCQISFGLFFSL